MFGAHAAHIRHAEAVTRSEMYARLSASCEDADADADAASAPAAPVRISEFDGGWISSTCPARRPMRLWPMDGYVLLVQPETVTLSNLGCGRPQPVR
jgi:hypothetical protein